MSSTSCAGREARQATGAAGEAACGAPEAARCCGAWRGDTARRRVPRSSASSGACPAPRAAFPAAPAWPDGRPAGSSELPKRRRPRGTHVSPQVAHVFVGVKLRRRERLNLEPKRNKQVAAVIVCPQPAQRLAQANRRSRRRRLSRRSLRARCRRRRPRRLQARQHSPRTGGTRSERGRDRPPQTTNAPLRAQWAPLRSCWALVWSAPPKTARSVALTRARRTRRWLTSTSDCSLPPTGALLCCSCVAERC